MREEEKEKIIGEFASRVYDWEDPCDDYATIMREVLAPMLAKIAALEAENSKAQEDIYISRCDVGAAQKTAAMFADEFKHLRDKIEALEAENAALRANNQTLDQVLSNIAEDLGCACDNEAILQAIEALRQQPVVDDEIMNKVFKALGYCAVGPSTWKQMHVALEAALGKDDADG